VLALLALGPFALILVWKSQRMGVAWKWALALVITVYSVYCIYLLYIITAFTVRHMLELNHMLIT